MRRGLRTALLVLALAGLGAGCGSEAVSASASTSAGSEAPTTDATVANVCPISDPAVLTEALGQPATETTVEVDPQSTPTLVCRFTAGPFVVSFKTMPHTPDGAGSRYDFKGTIPPTAPRIDGITVPNASRVSTDRGGYWTGDATFIDSDGDTIVLVNVYNFATGSDTYQPTDGPPQRSVTERALVAITNAASSYG